jgi:signal transduction histidine kinase
MAPMPKDASSATAAGRARARAVTATAGLLAVLLAINGVAIWGVVSARRSAEAEAVRDLGLTTAARARSLEAALASLAGDLIFLSQTPALVDAPQAMASDDPMVARWARVGAEGSLLLFLESHDEVERAVARAGADDGGGAPGRVLVAVGRRQGAPVVLPPESVGTEPAGDGLHAARWPLGPTPMPVGMLEVWVAPRRLLAAAVPGAGEELSVEPLPVMTTAASGPPGTAGDDPATAPVRSHTPPSDGDGGGFAVRRDDAGDLVVSALVLDEGWDPPLHWELVRRVPAADLLRSFDRLASRYRTTLALNVGVVTLTLILGALAFREARRSARLAAQNAQEKKVRELERQVMHSERLASVGRLAAGMAHEINNPLEGMANYLDLLRDDLERGDVDGARQLTGRVREGLERAAGITRRVLGYSDPGRAPKGVLDLRRALDDAVGFVRGSRAFVGVEVTLAAGDEPLPVRAEPTALGQLFLNLLLNACEAQPSGGRVEVTARRRVAAARVEIADQGPGIPQEVRDHLFEPFYSTRGSTGLGLSVCHGVVSDHGGSIHAVDRPEGGACFVVELPLADRPTSGEASTGSTAGEAPEPTADAPPKLAPALHGEGG